MRFGLQSWALRPLHLGPPWEDALKDTAQLGYDCTELIVCAPEELETYWEPKATDIKNLCADLGLAISQFVMFQPVSEDLVNLDEGKRALAFEHVRASAEIASKLGTPILNFVAPWPIGMEAPIPYIPRYYYVDDIGGEPKLKMRLPENFIWESLWSVFVDAIGTCLEICEEYDLVLSIENHLHTMMPTTDAFLRLWESFRSCRLGYNMDIGWLFLAREYVPWSVYKAGKHLVNVHLRDCDGFARHFVCPGTGAIDFQEIRNSLDDVGYLGDVVVELSEYEDRKAIARTTYELVGDIFK